MSGRNTNKGLSRKEFLLQLGALALVPAACRRMRHQITGSIVGANSSRGHQLRSAIEQKPVSSKKVSVVIVGGGIAGLSAANELMRNGITDFVLLEMSNEVGGNAASGKNAVSRYPWGAHYLPVPDERDKKLLAFLEEHHVVTGYDAIGLPVYSEEYLCFDPEERLYINGYWQEGLIPKFGVPAGEANQIARFFKEIEQYRNAKGEDGKDAFCIPVYQSSSDNRFKRLDKITFAAYLQQNGYTSPYLFWYLDYCTKDDYGGTIRDVSAWAGIHYFAARKGKAANTNNDTVLTWPEGNSWLVNKLRKKVEQQIVTDALVFKVGRAANANLVHYLHGAECREIVAQQVIVATPQFISQRILQEYENDFGTQHFEYAPWMVANITIDTFYENIKGIPMSWDNVIYGSKSLGYVNASHQHMVQFDAQRVLTYYYPLCDADPKTERARAMSTTHEAWVKLIVDDLKVVHPGIEDVIKNIDTWIWGHGMILPKPGLQQQRMARALVPDNGHGIYLAHSDLSGISIFEEAFHQGINAAGKIIAQKNDQQ